MKKICSLLCLISVFLTFSFHAQAEQAIYKKILPNGQILYSNQSGPGAEQIQLQPMPPPQISSPPPAFEMPDNPAEVGPKHYEIKFNTPQNEQTFTPGQPNIDISLSTNPTLYASDKVQLFLDNIPYGNLQSDLTYTLSHLNRGSHSLQAKIYSVTNKNEPKGETGIIVVYIQRPSIQLPPH